MFYLSLQQRVFIAVILSTIIALTAFWACI